MHRSQIHLIRHGITEGNQKRWFYGDSDIPLADEGRKELSQLAAAGIYPVADGTQNRGKADLYTSGMLRTEQTFLIIYGNREHAQIKDLVEFHFGDFEMKTHEELKGKLLYQQWIADKTGEASAPKGESSVAFSARVMRGYDTLFKKHHLKEVSLQDCGKEAHSIAVCHGGVIAAIMMHKFSADNKNLYQWIPDPGHGYSITIENGKEVSYKLF